MLAISIASPGNSQSKVESNLVEIQSKKKYSFKLTTNSKDFLIPAISQGFYLINFDRGESSENLSFEVSVVYGAKSWSNFFLFSILMSIPTLVVLVLNFKFETQRKKRKILGAGEN